MSRVELAKVVVQQRKGRTLTCKKHDHVTRRTNGRLDWQVRKRERVRQIAGNNGIDQSNRFARPACSELCFLLLHRPSLPSFFCLLCALGPHPVYHMPCSTAHGHPPSFCQTKLALHHKASLPVLIDSTCDINALVKRATCTSTWVVSTRHQSTTF